ncbi:MAG: molybdopterin-binding protein [Rhodobacteraceae bacterium]|nr:molybdopterin-binding protein [Paracoccaceae bacterium]
MTVSDTRSFSNDRSGDLLVRRVRSDGHAVIDRVIVKDELAAIRSHLEKWIADDAIDAVVTTGGTGLTGRDVTVEAHHQCYEKHIPAFETVFTMVSHRKIGSSAVQSRACAGVANGTYLFALPGSPGACADAWDEILTHQFNRDHRPCNFVEIMPRLREGMT